VYKGNFVEFLHDYDNEGSLINYFYLFVCVCFLFRRFATNIAFVNLSLFLIYPSR
jgi:hypothetical protein